MVSGFRRLGMRYVACLTCRGAIFTIPYVLLLLLQIKIVSIQPKTPIVYCYYSPCAMCWLILVWFLLSLSLYMTTRRSCLGSPNFWPIPMDGPRIWAFQISLNSCLDKATLYGLSACIAFPIVLVFSIF